MGLGIGHGLHLGQEIALKISIEQKRGYMLEMQLALSGLKSGEKLEITERCPGCNVELKPIEVLEGFSSDPTDLDTTCPHCGKKFRPKMRAVRFGSRNVEHYQLYCPAQTLHALRSHCKLPPFEIERANAALYRSAILHFGTLKAAMKEARITYRFTEKMDWKVKLAPILGRVPDVMFAKYAGVSPATVGKYRRMLGIRRFTSQEIYE